MRETDLRKEMRFSKFRRHCEQAGVEMDGTFSNHHILVPSDIHSVPNYQVILNSD